MKNENQFSRTGTVIPNERVRKSHELLQYAMDKMNERNLTCLFDMTHNNGGEYALHGKAAMPSRWKSAIITERRTP